MCRVPRGDKPFFERDEGVRIAILSCAAPEIDDSGPFAGCGGCKDLHTDAVWLPGVHHFAT